MTVMMIAFLANTPETLGWLFTHLTQAPELLKAVRAECDALGDSYINANFKQATPLLYSAFFETFRHYVFTGTPATVIKPCKLPGMGDHVFQPGDILHSMGEASAMDVEVYGPDARLWKGHRFVGEGEKLLKYDLTFGIGRSRKSHLVVKNGRHADRSSTSACPGRNFAIAELCMLAARMIQTFDFSDFSVTEHLPFEDGDFDVRNPVPAPVPKVDVIDLDGKVKSIIHPRNRSDHGQW